MNLLNRKNYVLTLETDNVIQTINIELSPHEVDLMNDIEYSLLKQKASIVLSVKKIVQ